MKEEIHQRFNNIEENIGFYNIYKEMLEYFTTDQLNDFANHLYNIYSIDTIEDEILNEFKEYMTMIFEHIITCNDNDYIKGVFDNMDEHIKNTFMDWYYDDNNNFPSYAFDTCHDRLSELMKIFKEKYKNYMK